MPGPTYEDSDKEIQRLNERILVLEKLNAELADQNKELIGENKELAQRVAHLPKRSKKEKELRGEAKSLRYKMVTVMFSDVKGFTKITDEKNAEALVDELDEFYLHFDHVVEKYNIQKIKSIGDTYIAAGGMPKKNRTNAIEMILAALEMRDYLLNLQAESAKVNKKIWDLTFGIHTGPVVAKISGKKKISYEIKGDTVNIASRIESSSDVGLINISDMTYEFVKDYFVCEYMAKIPIKYQGDLTIYTVKGFRPELSVGGKGIEPNEKFKTKFQLIKYDDLEEYMLDWIEKELPKHLYYHNLKHTIDVINGVEIIGISEGIDNYEMLLLKTAAVFHDCGQIWGSVGHEAKGVEVAKEILPKWGYTDKEIDIIEGIIMATKLPPTPKTKLEQIICDADLDYLGRPDFVPVSQTLFRELKVQNLIGLENDWNKLQIKFLSVHQFFTDTAKNMRQVNKEAQIERLTELIVED